MKSTKKISILAIAFVTLAIAGGFLARAPKAYAQYDDSYDYGNYYDSGSYDNSYDYGNYYDNSSYDNSYDYGNYYDDSYDYGNYYDNSYDYGNYYDNDYSGYSSSYDCCSNSSYSQPSYDYSSSYDCCSSTSYQPYSYVAPTYSAPAYTYSAPTYTPPAYTYTPPTYTPPTYTPPTYTPPTYTPPPCNCTPPPPPTCNTCTCSNSCPPPPPVVIPLVVSCAANPSSVNVGNNVTWTATVSGGNGNYSYSWSGAASGNSQYVYQSYGASGTQTATVTVTSNGQSQTANCSTYVNQLPPPPPPPVQNLYLTCYASQQNVQNGQHVTWNATASGGNGNYYYSWNGTDGLYGSGQTVSQSYYYPGTKTATVTVMSNGQSQTANCSTYVVQQNIASNVTVYTNPGPIIPPPTGAVYLSQVPYTGLADSWKLWAFFAAIVSFSAFAAYKMLRPKALENIAASAPIAFIPGGNAEIDVAGLEAAARGRNILLSDDAIAYIAEKARAEKAVATEVLSTIASKLGAGNGSWTALSKEKIVAMG